MFEGSFFESLWVMTEKALLAMRKESQEQDEKRMMGEGDVVAEEEQRQHLPKRVWEAWISKFKKKMATRK